MLPEIQAAAPDGLELKLDFDQSVFVRARGRERRPRGDHLLDPGLADDPGLPRQLAEHGDRRRLSIPLSIFAGIVGLFLTGQTINLMTLGGLALAIGLLVDNATVTIENIHRNQALGKPLTVAILDGSSEVIQPLTVATLAICIVFFPVVLLTGPARFLFIPLAITVVLAMLASYVLSFTVVPALARYLLKDHRRPRTEGHRRAHVGGVRSRLRARSETATAACWRLSLQQRKFVLGCFALLIVATGALAPVDRHRLLPDRRRRHHQAARPRAARHAARGDREDRGCRSRRASARSFRPRSCAPSIDTIGVPFSLNLAFVPSDNTSGMDAETPDLAQARRTSRPWNTQRLIRDKLHAEFPGTLFYFQTADIVSQVLNFGLSAPIDIQIQDPNFARAYALGAAHAAGDPEDPRRGRSAHRPGAGLPDASRSTSTASAPRGWASRSATSPTTC